MKEEKKDIFPPDLQDKYQRLQTILKDMDKVLIAFSGGVDSSLLLKTAKDVLGENVLAVFATSEIYPDREKDMAFKIARLIKAPLKVIQSKEMQNPEFVKNPLQRCFLCKTELFSDLKNIAKQEGIPYVADGANHEDLDDFRPGSKAAEELGIRSPLKEAGLVKKEIRELSRKLGLPNWDKPSMACLASRFPYHHPLNPEDLKKVAQAEEYLFSLDFQQFRVRHHNKIARIEVLPQEITRLIEKDTREKIVEKFKEIGYTYITVDLAGYRTGSLNETLSQAEKTIS